MPPQTQEVTRELKELVGLLGAREIGRRTIKSDRSFFLCLRAIVRTSPNDFRILGDSILLKYTVCELANNLWSRSQHFVELNKGWRNLHHLERPGFKSMTKIVLLSPQNKPC
jgi:hypothetical protein